RQQTLTRTRHVDLTLKQLLPKRHSRSSLRSTSTSTIHAIRVNRALLKSITHMSNNTLNLIRRQRSTNIRPTRILRHKRKRPNNLTVQLRIRMNLPHVPLSRLIRRHEPKPEPLKISTLQLNGRLSRRQRLK